MKKLAFFTDIHSNYEAIKVIYQDSLLEEVDQLYQLGDFLAIGPEPKEVTDFIMDKAIFSIKGNHEIYYTDIIEKGTTDLHESELTHQKWVAKTLGNDYYEIISQLPYEKTLEYNGVTIHLCHFPYKLKQDGFDRFYSFDTKIDHGLFTNSQADLYLFGHHHKGSDWVDEDGRRFVNIKSSGATPANETYYLIVEVEDGSYSCRLKTLDYDKATVINRLDERKVPERDFIKKVFFGLGK